MLTPEQKAEGARRILSDPVFLDAVEEVDAGLVAEWRISQTVEAREAAFAKQEALRLVLTQLRIIGDRA